MASKEPIEAVTTRVSTILTVLGIGDTFDDVFVTESIDEVRQSILNYCNIDSVPDELKYVWVDMTIDLLRWWVTQIQVASPESGGPSVVGGPMIPTSLREGSVSVGLKSVDEMSSSPSTARTIAGALDQVVNNYVSQLNKFRRMTW